MKKPKEALPNHCLTNERLHHDWSQERLAELIGTTSVNVSRWERGVTKPGPYFRQRLCNVFDKTPEELGLVDPALPENHASDHAASVGISQDAKVSGRSPSRRFVSRRYILLSLGVLGLMILGLGGFFVLPTALIRVTTMTNTTSIAGASKTNGGIHICWGANIQLPAQCMNLKNNTFKANQPILLWSSQSGNGQGWSISPRGIVGSTWPFIVPDLSIKYHGDRVVYFEKTTGDGIDGCIGVSPDMTLAWEPCGHIYTNWVISKSGYIINVSHSNNAGAPVAVSVCDASNGGSIRLGVEGMPHQCIGGWTFI